MNLRIGQRSGARSALGQLLRGVIGVLLALLVVRSWFVEPFIVPSGSMAPTLLGVHADVVCRQCGFRFAYGLNDGAAARVVCPNCGQVQIESTDPPGLDGDHVLVDRGAFRWRSPRRWEPVAFRSPTASDESLVKRVAGLPGETIEIRDGDIYADGHLQRKSLTEQRALAIVVHDSAFENPRSSATQRWQTDTGSTHWWRNADQIAWSDNNLAAENSPRDWLSYHHRQLEPGSSTELIEAPVTDRCAYNQTQSRRELYPVRDLALACHLRATGSGQIIVSATDGEFEFLARFDFGHQAVELLRDGARVASAPCEFPEVASKARWYVSLFDQQVTIAWNDKLLISYPYERPERSRPPLSGPFRIAATGMELDILNLRVERDVYYTPPLAIAVRNGSAGKTRLGPDEYFVLGDNSPESHDSRWPDFGPGVPAHLLIGKPIVVYYPARVMPAWGWSFQVPEFSNIRYIR